MKNRQNTADRERSIYRFVENQLKKEYPQTWADFIISPSYLRAEKALVNTSARYIFDLKKNGNEIATEVKLDRNDRFVVTRFGLFLSLQFTASIGKEVLQSYPNATILTGAGLTTLDLEAIYNGFSSLKIANRVNIENLSNQEFRYVPDTQQAAAGTKSTYNTDDATYKPAPVITLDGTMDIQYSTDFPTYAGIGLTPTDPANGIIKLVLVMYGFLIKGAAKNK